MTRRPEEGAELSQADARRILETRAKALAQPLEEPEPQARGRAVELLAFSCAGAAYAVPAMHVVEVIPLVNPTPVPGTPHAILGVVNHRGRVLPVIDVGRLLPPDAHDAPGASLVVAVELGDASFGIRADAVSGVVSVGEDEVSSAARFREEHDSVVSGVTESMMAVLDMEALARDPRITINDEVE